MITSTNLADPDQPPDKAPGAVRIASLDVEWTKNYRVRNGNRPFCYSVVYLDLPARGAPADIATVPTQSAGKTTLVHAPAAHFRERGVNVRGLTVA